MTISRSPSSSSVFTSPSCTRLVSIVAHVDHGKTSLADSLVEYNGIISERLAGTMRFLDSLEEEQRRGITIKSSAIALKHSYTPPPSSSTTTASTNNIERTRDMDMVIHILDSPGHVDFSMEVTSALQICDGAVLLVDVVEGMCARTHSILREAYSMNLVPILVLNKMDRLCLDLKLSPNEAYIRIRHVIESVNAAASNIIRSALADSQDDLVPLLLSKDTQKEEMERDIRLVQEKENIWTFEPSKGNVVFASALFGWGFTIPTLARSLFRSKVIPNIKPPVLKQYLFGDYKYCSESGKVTKWKHQPSSSLISTSQSNMNTETLTMFAEYALQPLWAIYDGVHTAAISVGLVSPEDYQTPTHPSTQKSQSNASTPMSDSIKIQATSPGMDTVLASLLVGSTTPINLLASLPQSIGQLQLLLNQVGASSELNVLRGILRRYRPLSNAILDAICEHCPSPVEASTHARKSSLSLVTPTRINTSLNEGGGIIADENYQNFQHIQNAVEQCKVHSHTGETDIPTVAHVCKFVATELANINDPDLKSSFMDSSRASSGLPNKSIMLGVARVLSGTLCSQTVEYYVFGPKHQLMESDQRTSIRLYLIMGATFLRVQEVPAGHICAVYGLEDFQLKSLILCDNKCGMPLVAYSPGLRPLVKVNIEAVSASDTNILEVGLKKLSLADASVEATITAKGEHILACLGEIHLEQSLLDLRKLYCGQDIELRISDPIIEFGECTEWFENEVGDHEQFFDDKSPPLRQVTVPPYCYEDGLSYAKRGRSRAILSGRGAAIHVRVIPLSHIVYSCLKARQYQQEAENDLTMIFKALNIASSQQENCSELFDSWLSRIVHIDDQGSNILVEGNGICNGSCIRGIENGDLLVPSPDQEEQHTAAGSQPSVIQQCIRAAGNIDIPFQPHDIVAKNIWTTHMRGSTVAGFQSACRAGPLCEEPLRGILVIIEGAEIAIDNRDGSYEMSRSVSGGMVVTCMRQSIRSAFLTRPVRLCEQHFRLTLHSSLTGLGPLYAVLSKRRGKVSSDTMVEGTDLISIIATIPQAESFRLAPELLEKSSGEVTAPELVFSHWEILQEDPFWIPTSLEEREDYGEIVSNGDRSTGLASHALKYIRSVRQRKGLIVDSSKIVVAAEKQRTLARKK